VSSKELGLAISCASRDTLYTNQITVYVHHVTQCRPIIKQCDVNAMANEKASQCKIMLKAIWCRSSQGI